MSSTFGNLFRVTTFGESHGAAIGCVVDGCPAGIGFDLAFIQSELDRRRPGQSSIVTQRKESDTVQVLSGVFEGRTTGTPIAFLIPNEDQRSRDYDHLATAFRPSHGDYTWQAKFGHRDYRGGGRSSARETAARVAAGALAKLLLRTQGIEIQAFVSQVGHLELKKDYTELDLSLTETNDIRCPDPVLANKMISLIKKIRKEGDTIGGVVTGVVRGCPPGLGEPVFDKLHADLGKAMLSINAAKGFEYGSGFAGVKMRGSEHNDLFRVEKVEGVEGVESVENVESVEKVEKVESVSSTPSTPQHSQPSQPSTFSTPSTLTNHSGGIQGGISNGMDIYFRVAFKPVATIMRDQETLNAEGETVILKGKGRHDPCVVPRAVPIVEAMAALVLADHFLRLKANKI
ncbi:MAG: chorismate synthase [Phycisphaerae bacterium]|nr:chorismate synthase [Saprospiraceae bacterium]